MNKSMTVMKKLMLITMLAIISPAEAQKQNQKNSSQLNELLSLMQGTFSSEKQSKADTSYFDISLRMVPIWKERGNYFYVEQAMSKRQDKPYRVRIYKVYQREEQFVSEVYTLKNEKDWIGKWKDPALFDELAVTEIELKQGCEVILMRVSKGKFSGQTGEKTCPSELRGASYATSRVTISKSGIESWDQGFDKEGNQVWGAEKGGYIFNRIQGQKR